MKEEELVARVNLLARQKGLDRRQFSAMAQRVVDVECDRPPRELREATHEGYERVFEIMEQFSSDPEIDLMEDDHE